MPNRRLLPTALVTVMAAALLTACAAGGDFTDLHRDVRPDDALPAVAAERGGAAVPDTSRLVGTHEGAQLYLMRSTADGVCLLGYLDDDRWTLGCGGTPLKISGPAGTFQVVSDGEAAPEGATAVSGNVYALGQ